jgi:hypothetical protein
VRIDAAGKTVYAEVYNSADRTLIESFKIEDNGDLQFLGIADAGVSAGLALLDPGSWERDCPAKVRRHLDRRTI